jgi:ankyrin repeat protein
MLMGRLIQNTCIISFIALLFLPGYLIAIDNDIEAEFLMAVKKGNLDKVNSLLNNGADVNTAQKDGTSSLAWAVYNNNKELVDLLIRSGDDGADIDAANEYGVNPLHLACMNQNPELISTLLKAGANPNNSKWTGEAPLMTCANTGTIDAVKALLDQGADVNSTETTQEQTALMWAAAEKHHQVVKLLVERGANINAVSKITPEPEPFMVKTPGSMGQNFPSTLRFREATGGFTALLFAAQQGDLESTKILLDAGADINFATKEEGSALVIATAGSHEELAMYLLERGADPNIQDAYGLTPLHFALHEGVMIMNNWAPTETDSYGWERKNMPHLLMALLEHGADPEMRVKHAWSFLDNPFLARGMEDPSQIDIVGSTTALLAAASGDMESLRILVDYGVNTDVKTIGGATVFMLAAGAGAEKAVRDEQEAIELTKYVLSLGDIDVNVQLTDNRAKNGPGAGKIDGRNITHFAVTLGWSKMIHFLADIGVNLDQSDRYGMTPLMIAMGDPEVRYYRNIPVGRYDDRYRRPRANEEIEKVLLEAGASEFAGTIVDKGSVD